MARIVISNNKGLSLVEVLVAMVILLMVFLALMQTALVSIDANTTNLLRDEATSMAEAMMNEARNAPFATMVSIPTQTVRKKIRALKDPANSLLDFPFSVTRNVTDLGAAPNINHKQVNILVAWQWQGRNYSHSITTIRKIND